MLRWLDDDTRQELDYFVLWARAHAQSSHRNTISQPTKYLIFIFRMPTRTQIIWKRMQPTTICTFYPGHVFARSGVQFMRITKDNLQIVFARGSRGWEHMMWPQPRHPSPHHWVILCERRVVRNASVRDIFGHTYFSTSASGRLANIFQSTRIQLNFVLLFTVRLVDVLRLKISKRFSSEKHFIGPHS